MYIGKKRKKLNVRERERKIVTIANNIWNVKELNSMTLKRGLKLETSLVMVSVWLVVFCAFYLARTYT